MVEYGHCRSYSRQREEVTYMDRIVAFIAAVAVGVVSDRICKWLDGRRQ